MHIKDIIRILKANKEDHHIFMDLDIEVQNWIREHRKDNCLLILDEDGDWEDDINPVYKIKMNDVIYLDENYDPISPGCWVEYDVKDGSFYDEQRGVFFAWYDWPRFMSDNPRFTAFGGWQYSSYWHMTPQLSINGDLRDEETYINDEAKPAIPKKIRFWEEGK